MNKKYKVIHDCERIDQLEKEIDNLKYEINGLWNFIHTVERLNKKCFDAVGDDIDTLFRLL